MANRNRQNSRPSNRAKAAAFRAPEINIRAFGGKNGCGSTSRESDETLICPLIFGRYKRNTQRKSVQEKRRRNPGLYDSFFVSFRCSFAVNFSGTGIYFAIAADKYS